MLSRGPVLQGRKVSLELGLVAHGHQPSIILDQVRGASYLHGEPCPMGTSGEKEGGLMEEDSRRWRCQEKPADRLREPLARRGRWRGKQRWWDRRRM